MFSIDHIHPMTVHFPIALLIVGFIAEIIYLFFQNNKLFSEAAFWLLAIGTVAAVASYISGAFLTGDLRGAAGVQQNTHEFYAEITVISALVCTVFKIYLKAEKKEDSSLKWIVFLLYGIVALAVGITGYHGGVLVHDILLTQ
jgi:uncharacterized membrane protein